MFKFLLNIKENIFITGTDTNIGKTFVSKKICQHTQKKYWKPIESGVENGITSDEKTLQQITETYQTVYKLKLPLSPHLAAANEGLEIDLSKIINFFNQNVKNDTIIEGAGGIMVPINKNFLMIDLIKQLNIPVIIVAKDQLGTINHTLMTIDCLRMQNIKILGFVMNFYQENSKNAAEIEKYGKIELIEKIPTL